jgi:hypothetical protein
VELGLGASSAAEIELIAADDQSSAYHTQVQGILSQG